MNNNGTTRVLVSPKYIDSQGIERDATYEHIYPKSRTLRLKNHKRNKRRK